MRAGAEYGELITQPVTFSGQYLFVNVAAEGDLLAELLTADGKPIEPFTLAECVAVAGDHTAARVTWRKQASLQNLKDQHVRIRFRLREGDLYAFWVSSDLRGSSAGYVAGGGPGFNHSVDTAAAGSGA
jgi:hypothetical protein